jgi:anaerobic nitric oxide reductase transcription regulator
MSDITSSALIELAVDLTNSLTSGDRFDRLLNTVRRVIRCDAVVLLSCRESLLKPLAQEGLMPDILGRRFTVVEHPRFKSICGSLTPVRFPSNSPLPDPYDGMLLATEGDLPVHACMGLPLLSDGELIGVLTLDSLTPNVFDDIPERTLTIIAAMSAAALKTAMLLQTLERHSQRSQSVVEALTHDALVKDGGELIGDSESMRLLKRDITLVAPSDFSVLIEGETGVGKELVARTLHEQSNRHHQALVYVNCAAIPENLVESELFGHVKGAFTSADKSRAGKFSLADGGTIFLDEIGELPLAAQSKLLRVLQNQEIQPVGQDNVERIDVRIIAATNRVLKEEVEGGRFRADLYHRLRVYPLRVPPLKERDGDIVLLAGYFAEQVRRKLGLQQLTLSPKTIHYLHQYHWPGNVRELEHVISRAALRAKDASVLPVTTINVEHIEVLIAADTHHTLPLKKIKSDRVEHSVLPLSLRETSESLQRELIHLALTQSGGHWTIAANSLGMDRANLRRMAKRLGVSVNKKITKE